LHSTDRLVTAPGEKPPFLLRSHRHRRLGGSQRLVEIGDDVVDVLDADRKAYVAGVTPLAS